MKIDWGIDSHPNPSIHTADVNPSAVHEIDVHTIDVPFDWSTY